jgi:hypothetical protein
MIYSKRLFILNNKGATMKKITLLSIMLIILSVSFVYAGDLSVRPIIGAELGYHYEETIATGVTSDAIVIPPLKVGSKRVTCTIHAGANTGKFEFTTSSDAKITAGTAVWQDWNLGVVTGSNSDSLVGQVTGLRGVSSAGEIKIEIVY